MAKKIFVRARLVKSSRWYIDFSKIDPESGEETRHRKDFNLNDIEDLTLRQAVADRLVQNIEQFAPDGPSKTAAKLSEGPSVKEAVELAVAIKQRLPRKNSRRKYVTVSKPFLAWAKNCTTCIGRWPISPENTPGHTGTLLPLGRNTGAKPSTITSIHYAAFVTYLTSGKW